MNLAIVPIVEGQGEEQAIRTLINRIIAELDLSARVEIVHPFRVKRDSFLKAGQYERTIQQAAIRAASSKAHQKRILVLIDSDGDCPLTAGPALVGRATQARGDVPVSVVLAHCEFEAWFLAAAASLRGHRELSESMDDHPTPEDVRGAKEWLSRHMPPSRNYAPTRDQAALAAAFDMDVARRRSRSFRKLWKEVEAMLRAAAES